MPRQAKGISAAKVSKGRPGRYGDGGGLYLTIKSKTSKFWSFRYVRAGHMREIGLGAASGRQAVSLADARQKARELWDIPKAGRDRQGPELRAGRRRLHRGVPRRLAQSGDRAAMAAIAIGLRLSDHRPIQR